MRVPFLLFIYLTAISEIANSQDLSCSSAVTLDGGTLEVASDNSGDDTKNLQCALDFASEAGFRDIFLTSKTYNIGAVSATGFRGDLRGKSKKNTVVNIQNGALSCTEAMGAAIEFQVGNASVRNMTISVIRHVLMEMRHRSSPSTLMQPTVPIELYSETLTGL